MYVYIIFSRSLNKYYCGHTADIITRLQEYHNKGKAKFTSKGIPWVPVASLEAQSRTEAVQLERKIKNRGIKRFLEDRKLALPY
jgi:putative endonuclease